MAQWSERGEDIRANKKYDNEDKSEVNPSIQTHIFYFLVMAIGMTIFPEKICCYTSDDDHDKEYESHRYVDFVESEKTQHDNYQEDIEKCLI